MKLATNLVLAGALVVIAVLMVAAVILYMRNGSLLGGLFGESEVETTETPPETSELSLDIVVPPDPGLSTLDTGEIVYILTEDEAKDYDEANLIAIEPSWQQASLGQINEEEDYYYLAGSWLDVDGELYYFDEEGHACTDEYAERAFNYEFNEDGTLEEINYNSLYRESSSTANVDYPGLLQTGALRVYMDSSRSLGDYVALKYKKATESLTYYLGGESNTQYASPYAFDICDGRIYYLSLANRQDNANTKETGNIYENIAGKVFCMTPGADKRYIAAQEALGFKVLTDEDQNATVYYYDGDRIRKSTTLTEDENMVVFTEDADYTVNIDTEGKAYLELTTGQRVSMASDAFKAGNFTYKLAEDGEILSIAEKTTVSTGGYTYEFQNGTAFGVDMTRLIREDSEGNLELISGEAPGKTANIHFDYSSSCIIAEYEDNNGGGGLIKATLDGDIDLITESKTTSGTVELYGISNGEAIYKVTEGENEEFRKASIATSSPIAAAVEPVLISSGDEEIVDAPSEQSGDSDGEEYDDTVQGQAPPDSTDQVSGNSGSANSSSGTTGPGNSTSGDTNSPVVVPLGPGSADYSSNSPGSGEN